MDRRLLFLLGILTWGCGDGGSRARPLGGEPAAVPEEERPIYKREDAAESDLWRPPEDAQEDAERWTVSKPLASRASPVMAMAVSATGQVYLAHVVPDMYEFGVSIKAVRYTRSTGWSTVSTVFNETRGTSYQGSYFVALEALEGGEALLVWYRTANLERENLYYASFLRGGSWSPAQRLTTGWGHRVERDGANKLHVLICGNQWKSWTFELGKPLAPSDVLDYRPVIPSGRTASRCDVHLQDGVLHGFGLSITSTENYVSYEDSPVTYVGTGSQAEEIGTISGRALLASAGNWASVLSSHRTFERMSDGTWQESRPLLDAARTGSPLSADPLRWIPELNILVYSHSDDASVIMRRTGDGWEGPFLAHPYLTQSSLARANGDLAVWWQVYDPEAGRYAPMKSYIQRRVGDTWYAAELLGEAKEMQPAMSSAGDLVVALLVDDTITLHARGPNFR